jgi:hypothetical protein
VTVTKAERRRYGGCCDTSYFELHGLKITRIAHPCKRKFCTIFASFCAAFPAQWTRAPLSRTVRAILLLLHAPKRFSEVKTDFERSAILWHWPRAGVRPLAVQNPLRQLVPF